MKKLTLRNILVISFVANIIFIVAGSYNYFSLVKNEGLPSFDRIDYDMVIFSGFFLIFIFFMPLEFIFKFIITKFRFYAFLTILILNSLLFLEAYMFAGTGYMYSTYESGTVLFVTILDSFPSIFFSSILFYFFLKYYLKPKKELPNE